MARPPLEVVPTIGSDEALTKLRAWPGFAAFAAWRVERADIAAYEPAQTELRLLLVAPPGQILERLKIPVELERSFTVDAARGGAVAEPEHVADLLVDLHDRLLALVRRAAGDGELRAWLSEHPGATARFEDLGGPDRLVIRAGIGDDVLPRIYPEP